MCPSWKHFHPICISYLLLCNNPTKWIKTTYIYYITLSRGRSLGTAFLESHKVTITVLTGLCFFLELGSSSRLPSVVVDRIQFLVARGLSLHLFGEL